MFVYFIRHGQSLANKGRYVCGQKDVDLTEQGYEDAKKAGKLLEGITFDRIFSSDLIRTVHTAQTAIPGCQPEQLQLIREINTGFISGRKFDELMVDPELGEAYAKARVSCDYTAFDGESANMQRDRIAVFKKQLEGMKDCNRIAVFTHEWVIYSMMRLVLSDSLLKGSVIIENGAVVVFEYKDEKWSLRSIKSYIV